MNEKSIRDLSSCDFEFSNLHFFGHIRCFIVALIFRFVLHFSNHPDDLTKERLWMLIKMTLIGASYHHTPNESRDFKSICSTINRYLGNNFTENDLKFYKSQLDKRIFVLKDRLLHYFTAKYNFQKLLAKMNPTQQNIKANIQTILTLIFDSPLPREDKNLRFLLMSEARKSLKKLKQPTNELRKKVYFEYYNYVPDLSGDNEIITGQVSHQHQRWRCFVKLVLMSGDVNKKSFCFALSPTLGHFFGTF